MPSMELETVYYRLIVFFSYLQNDRSERDNGKAAWERCYGFINIAMRKKWKMLRVLEGTQFILCGSSKVNGHPEIFKSIVRSNTRRHARSARERDNSQSWNGFCVATLTEEKIYFQKCF